MKLDIIRKVEALELRCAMLAKKAAALTVEKKRLAGLNKRLRAKNKLLTKALAAS
jgi:hypothetical protein